MADIIVNDEPDNVCFGCSPHNAQGLRMTFLLTGPGRVESRCTLEEHLAGAPGVIHGGIQATLLDEAMGVAAHRGVEDQELDIVTVDFSLRYRRPAPTGAPVVVRGALLRREGRDFFMEGAIESADGEVLTLAEARWRQIDRRRAG
jgi:uncharacterized protein (TIGR00369 family)